jgi:hypothetical protein
MFGREEGIYLVLAIVGIIATTNTVKIVDVLSDYYLYLKVFKLLGIHRLKCIKKQAAHPISQLLAAARFRNIILSPKHAANIIRWV